MTAVDTIVDAHCHVASDRFIPRQFMDDVAANVMARLDAEGQALAPARALAMVADHHQDHEADRLVAEMDRAGVARAVLLVPDFGLAMKCDLEPDEMAEAHHAIRLRHPGRFHVFVGVDPRRGAEGLAFFEQAVTDYGFEGLKLYPPCGFSPSDPMLDPYYELCLDRGLVVFLHTGPTARSLGFRSAHPIEVEGAARRFPDVPFVLGHGGVTHVPTAAYLAQYRPNVYLDLGGFAGATYPDGWEAHLRDLFRVGLNHKIVFGTDWPLNRMSGGLRRLVARFQADDGVLAGVRPRERRLVMAGNIDRLLPERCTT